MLYADYLMKARHDDVLRDAAKRQLAAEGRRARAARRRDGRPARLPRLVRLLQRRVPA